MRRSTGSAQHAGAVFHTHMPFASALTRLKDQRILPIGQTEIAIAMHTAYDDSYGGPAFDPKPKASGSPASSATRRS